MRLESTLLIRGVIVNEYTADLAEDVSFADALENAFVECCRNLSVSVPLWLEKNTREFARFRKTFFTPEHFLEAVVFDRLEIRMLR